MPDERRLFTSKAHFYATYRPQYPPDFFEYISKALMLNGTGRMLDLGCGTGQLTLPFAQYFKNGGLVITGSASPIGKDGWRIEENEWKEIR